MKRILIPTDGSACSERAVDQGLDLASQIGAEVTFLYALEDPLRHYMAPEMISYQPQLYDELKRVAEEALSRAMEMAAAADVTARSCLVEHNDPVEAIHEAEDEHDLVVMGTHGRRGMNRWLFGSVAEGALRRSTIPYLLVRGSDEPSEPEPAEGQRPDG